MRITIHDYIDISNKTIKEKYHYIHVKALINSRKVLLNKNVLTLFLKVVMFGSFLIFAGREFQSLGAAREKAQPPGVFLDLALGFAKSSPS